MNIWQKLREFTEKKRKKIEKKIQKIKNFFEKKEKKMEIKWIKITTDIFDNEKILLIESLPDGDSILVIWFKLLCLAGKQNNSGVFTLGDKIPYTEDMLATIFKRKKSTVHQALQTFETFGMVEMIDGIITLPNWDKHQSLDSYEKKKERDRLYRAEKRRQTKDTEKSSEKSSDSRSTGRLTVDDSRLVEVEEEGRKRKKSVEKSDTHTPISYDFLVNKYGKAFVDERVERAKQYKNVTLEKIAQWCEEDAKKTKMAKSGKRNTFTDFSLQRNFMIDESSLLANNK